MDKHDYVSLAKNEIIDEAAFNDDQLVEFGKLIHNHKIMLESLKTMLERYECKRYECNTPVVRE
jgi:hypothetical protein